MQVSRLSVWFSSVLTIVAVVACGSSSNTDSNGSTYSCGAVGEKLCPGDAPQTQADVDACKACYSQVVALAQCAGVPATPACGADGTSDAGTTDPSVLQTCGDQFAAVLTCSFEQIAGDGGGFFGDDDFDAGLGDAQADFTLALPACQITADGPAGSTTGTCSSGGATVASTNGIVTLSLQGDAATVDLAADVGQVLVGAIYPAVDPADFPGIVEDVSVQQSGYTCSVSSGGPAPFFADPATSLSVTFSTWNPAGGVVHGTVTGSTECSALVDAGTGYGVSGATVTFTF